MVHQFGWPLRQGGRWAGPAPGAGPRHRAPPRVQVGAADAGLRDLEDDGARLRVRDVELLDLEGGSRPREDNDATFHGSPPAFVTISRAQVRRLLLNRVDVLRAQITRRSRHGSVIA